MITSPSDLSTDVFLYPVDFLSDSSLVALACACRSNHELTKSLLLKKRQVARYERVQTGRKRGSLHEEFWTHPFMGLLALKAEPEIAKLIHHLHIDFAVMGAYKKAEISPDLKKQVLGLPFLGHPGTLTTLEPVALHECAALKLLSSCTEVRELEITEAVSPYIRCMMRYLLSEMSLPVNEQSVFTRNFPLVTHLIIHQSGEEYLVGAPGIWSLFLLPALRKVTLKRASAVLPRYFEWPEYAQDLCNLKEVEVINSEFEHGPLANFILGLPKLRSFRMDHWQRLQPDMVDRDHNGFTTTAFGDCKALYPLIRHFLEEKDMYIGLDYTFDI